MLLRIRWFIMGSLASLGLVGYLIKQLRKARERITPGNVARSGMRGMADVLDNAAARMRQDGQAR
ncbi:MAG: hypothetical protein WBV06_00095 [Acidimicrobiia bacterium]